MGAGCFAGRFPPARLLREVLIQSPSIAACFALLASSPPLGWLPFCVSRCLPRGSLGIVRGALGARRGCHLRWCAALVSCPQVPRCGMRRSSASVSFPCCFLAPCCLLFGWVCYVGWSRSRRGGDEAHKSVLGPSSGTCRLVSHLFVFCGGFLLCRPLVYLVGWLPFLIWFHLAGLRSGAVLQSATCNHRYYY